VNPGFDEMTDVADVVDEDGAVDEADPLWVSIRIYRVRNVGSTAGEPPSKMCAP
jgi:hypothetical protein